MAKIEPKVNPNSVNLIHSSAVFTGELKTETDIKFNGKLEGKLETASKLVLGQEGFIKGEVKCKNATISGRVEGKIFVEELLELLSTAHIEGEIFTSKLSIEQNAVFNGTCTMTKKQSTETKKEN